MIITGKAPDLFAARRASDAVFISGAADTHAVAALNNLDIWRVFVQLQPLDGILGATIDLPGAFDVIRLWRHMIANGRV